MQNETNQGHKKDNLSLSRSGIKRPRRHTPTWNSFESSPPVSNLNYCSQDRNKKHKKHKNVPLILDPDR